MPSILPEWLQQELLWLQRLLHIPFHDSSSASQTSAASNNVPFRLQEWTPWLSHEITSSMNAMRCTHSSLCRITFCTVVKGTAAKMLYPSGGTVVLVSYGTHEQVGHAYCA